MIEPAGIQPDQVVPPPIPAPVEAPMPATPKTSPTLNLFLWIGSGIFGIIIIASLAFLLLRNTPRHQTIVETTTSVPQATIVPNAADAPVTVVDRETPPPMTQLQAVLAQCAGDTVDTSQLPFTTSPDFQTRTMLRCITDQGAAANQRYLLGQTQAGDMTNLVFISHPDSVGSGSVGELLKDPERNLNLMEVNNTEYTINVLNSATYPISQEAVFVQVYRKKYDSRSNSTVKAVSVRKFTSPEAQAALRMHVTQTAPDQPASVDNIVMLTIDLRNQVLSPSNPEFMTMIKAIDQNLSGVNF